MNGQKLHQLRCEEQCSTSRKPFWSKVTTDFRNDFERVTKRSAFTVRNQIKVTFTITCLNVCQTMISLAEDEPFR